MDGKRFLLAATYLAAFFGLLTPVLVAQVASADLVGQVTDASRAVISSVNITVENASTGLIRRTTTDESGNWTITALPIGTYRLRAEHAGFKAAALSESVEVMALAPALQADSSSIGALVTSSAVQNLPLNGRNFIRLAQLVPGANESVQNAMSSGNRPDDRRRTSSLSVNGMHDYANNFMIDGMDNNERAIGTMVLLAF